MSATQSPLVLNNMIVDQLRSGDPGAVDALIKFGLRPDLMIDQVDVSSGSSANSTRRSAWFWSHQAPTDGAVAQWWKLLDRQLASSSPFERMSILGQRFEEACEAGLEQPNIDTLALTWSKSLLWAGKDGWSRNTMMAYLTMSASRLGGSAASGLRGLANAGLINPDDWTVAARRSYSSDPLSVAVNHDQCELAETMLDLGCSPVSQDGLSLLTIAWSRLRQEVDKSDIQVDGMASPANMVEFLLNHGLDWNVPSAVGSSMSIAEDAVRILPFLATRKNWEKLAHQIERTSLEENTPRGLSPRRTMPRI
jgi:hypothetical protein